MDTITDKFKSFLEESGVSKLTLKNYMSDLNNFAKWLIESTNQIGAHAPTRSRWSLDIVAKKQDSQRLQCRGHRAEEETERKGDGESSLTVLSGTARALARAAWLSLRLASACRTDE